MFDSLVVMDGVCYAAQAALTSAAAEAGSVARAAGALTASGAAMGELPAGLTWLLQFVLALTVSVAPFRGNPMHAHAKERD